MAWQVPYTRTLLKGNISIRTVAGGMFMATAETIAANLSSMPILGSAQKLLIEMERRSNGVRREFNPSLQGAPVETYPGLPNYHITMSRANIYDINVNEAFGFSGVNILEQFVPIVVVATQVTPVDSSGNPLVVDGRPLKARTYIIPGCWFDKIALDFSIVDEDQMMVQELPMIAQTVFVQ